MYIYTYFISIFGGSNLYTRISNINFLKFQQSYNLFLRRFQAERNPFQCNFDYKHLFIKINQKSIMQTT